ncbi:MAG TPA: VOC family protein [Armatimonadaceae bacterium]|jgi:catechol 2,3-dioxygenase-like lactoylglutathione lyase family enzyme|nr:VOC family protein [Armatimonadaceae bacterium]
MSYQFDHAAQVVPDVGEAVAWYQRVLPGVRVLHQDATWAFIEAGGVKLAFVVRDQHPGHLAWRVDDAELERLAAENGREIKPHRDGTRSFYLEAPGGQSIEIISYTGSRWEAGGEEGY